MNRRSFLRSLGVLLVAPATLVRAAGAESRVDMHRRLIRQIAQGIKDRGCTLTLTPDNTYRYAEWERQCGKTEMRRQMARRFSLTRHLKSATLPP